MSHRGSPGACLLKLCPGHIRAIVQVLTMSAATRHASWAVAEPGIGGTWAELAWANDLPWTVDDDLRPGLHQAFHTALQVFDPTRYKDAANWNRNRISLECHGFTGHWLQSQGALCSLRAATPILGACYLVSCANVPHAVCLAVPAGQPTPRSPACAGIAARAL